VIGRTAVWTTIAWIVLIISGASTTGVLRAPLTNSSVVSASYQFHRFAGTVVGLLGLIQLTRVGRRSAWTWIGTGLVAGTIASGWLSTRLLEPRTSAIHAFMAALTAVALFSVASASGLTANLPRSRARWVTVSAQLAFGLVVAQVAVGALLRHQQIGLTSHFLVGGLAVVTLLAPAVAVLQDPAAFAVERRAAQWAITAAIVQVGLGIAVLLMILIGRPSVEAWLTATVAHVTVGTLTLLATARFALTLRPLPGVRQ